LRFCIFEISVFFNLNLLKEIMKKSSLTLLTIFALLFLKSCNSYPMDKTHISDINRNTEELQKRQEAEKRKIEASEFNNFGKPDSK
jgi:PBP1b-binding outer membrane lipoprotein LpoB